MRFLKNKFTRLFQRPNHCVRIVGASFPILVVDKKRITTSRLPCRHVPPPITHHKTTREIYLPLVRRVNQHPRFWFSTITTIRVRVITRPDVVTQPRDTESVVHRLYHFPGLNAGSDIRLVRNDDDQKSSLVQRFNCLFRARKKFKLFQNSGGIRPAIAHYCAINHPITIEEHRSLHVTCTENAIRVTLTTLSRSAVNLDGKPDNARPPPEMLPCVG